ncbi:MAG: hypothetical protein Q8J64_03950 [Thermodesulfovibrionales bacterium]|nr:hypothetical protein [Thermodesulfovibrionales bacterium]
MIETEFMKALINAGVGAFIALLILVGLYRIAHRIGIEFVRAQQAQAEALGRQAQSMEGLTMSIQDFVGRDSGEHREMLVLLRFIAQQQQTFDEVKVEHNYRKKQAHPHCPVKSS